MAEKRKGAARSVSMWSEVSARPEELSVHHRGALGWAGERGEMIETLRSLRSSNLRAWILNVLLVITCGALYKSERVRVFVPKPGASGVALRTEELEQLTDVSETMKRQSIVAFFHGLRAASRDARFQEEMGDVLSSLTAAGSPAHQAVEAFVRNELPARQEREVRVLEVSAFPITVDKWRLDLVEVDRTDRRSVYRGQVSVDVAVEAPRNTRHNPWGVFVKSYSLDLLEEGVQP